MVYIVMLLFTVPLAYLWKIQVEQPDYIPKIRLGNNYQIVLKKNIWPLMAFTPIYIVYAFQYSLHTDYDNYEQAFLRIKAGTGSIREVAVHYINKLVAIAGLDFQFVYIIIYLIAFVILAKCLADYSRDYAVSLVLFVTVFFTLGFLQIRQLVAVIISLYAYRFINSERFIMYALTVICACLFHISAIIMLPAYFILKYDFKCSYYVIAAAVFAAIDLGRTYVLTWLVKHFLPSYYGRHEMFRNFEINKWSMILLVLGLFLCVIYYDNVKEQLQENRLFLNGYFIYTILFFFGRWIIEFDRFGYFFYFPSICLIPNLIECEKNIYFKWLLKLGICMSATLFWIIRYKNGEMFRWVGIWNA